ncbi:SHOCT domain-containing protein, partial [Streptomyces sp. SID10692]|uniref:SHOCT domain-containing protein n=1 Tax=Streptomyces sp. SID10692 TaxID=2706026 RepID=UPI0013DA5290|nr:SHOCT domain-containing protein [Streptomyces sp. SID10692]
TAPAPAEAAEPAAPPAGDHDVLLRRLRELGELHRAGVLTDDEFSTAKQAVLRSM